MKNIPKRRRPFRHLNQGDRDRIEALKTAGHTQEAIAKVLEVSPGAISREISKRRRKKTGEYKASVAQMKADAKRRNSKYCGMKIEKEDDLRKRIIRELKQKRSPDEIAGRMKEEGLVPKVSTKAIYRWLYSNRGQKYAKYLCTKRYKKKRQRKDKVKREMIPNLKSLEQRPKEGIHAEGDLFVSPTKLKTTKSGFFGVIPESMLYFGKLMDNRSPETMRKIMNETIKDLPLDDITLDRGIENKYHEKFDIPAYFCDPHSPWQKVYVESGIGLVRRWFYPKGTNLEDVTEKEYQKCLHILNHKYRKSLGYKSAYEVSLERGIIQKIPPLGRGKG